MDIEEEHAKLLSRLEKEYEDMVRRASADDDKGAESDQGEKAGGEIELGSVGCSARGAVLLLVCFDLTPPSLPRPTWLHRERGGADPGRCEGPGP